MIKNTDKMIPYLISVLLGSILILGTWWIYLLSGLASGKISTGPSFSKMVFWEGLFFIVIIFSISVTTLFLFIKDKKNAKDLQTFFASLTHELKTPLASIRLQTDIIESKFQEDDNRKYVDRLKQDVNNLDIQMEKILQLSRVERNGKFYTSSVDLFAFLKEQHYPDFFLNLNIQDSKDLQVIADRTALQLILDNLVENTKRHTPHSNAEIKIIGKKDRIILSYRDNGTFEGEIGKLGSLFYKFDSPKGSGIGLYLIKKLSTKMKGQFKIGYGHDKKVTFDLILKRPRT